MLAWLARCACRERGCSKGKVRDSADFGSALAADGMAARPDATVLARSSLRAWALALLFSQAQEPLCSLSPQHRHPLRRTPGAGSPPSPA